jgi:uncharacterized membrane protein
MEPVFAIRIVELIAVTLEIVGAALIGIAFLYATARAIRLYTSKDPDAYDQLKGLIGRALQLGLEFLVAADIIRTVTVEPTREQIISLALLILVRTFLSWSITVELEGCWPWQVAELRKELRP